MRRSLKETWDQVGAALKELPKSWPEKLVFADPPTSDSPPYSPAVNYLQPNDGPCRLDVDDKHNRRFLRLQIKVARAIDLYQYDNTQQGIKYLEDLRSVLEEFEETKRNHWETACRTYTIGVFCFSHNHSTEGNIQTKAVSTVSIWYLHRH